MTYQPPPPGPGELDMDEIVRLICLTGTFAYIEQTGGGMATIYAGETVSDSNGDPRWTACGGPGFFLPNPDTGAVWAYARAVTADFHLGPEDETGHAISAAAIGLTTEAEAAAILVAQTRHRRLLTREEALAARDNAPTSTRLRDEQ